MGQIEARLFSVHILDLTLLRHISLQGNDLAGDVLAVDLLDLLELLECTADLDSCRNMISMKFRQCTGSDGLQCRLWLR